MQSHSWHKCVLAMALVASLIAVGCSTQWISVALEDLPVLTQMALNIATLVTTLQGARISDPVLLTRLSAAVNLIVSTVNSFAALMPQAKATTSQKSAAMKTSIPNAGQLRTSWNRQVCAPTGRTELDAAFARCAMR